MPKKNTHSLQTLLTDFISDKQSRSKVIMKALLILVFAIITGASTEDSLITKINPGCDKDCGNETMLVYTRSTVGNDSFHYIWSTIGSSPSFLVAQASSAANLTVNWKKMMSTDPGDSIKMTEDPSRIISVVLDKVVIWDDVNQTSVYNHMKHNKTIFSWNNFTKSIGVAGDSSYSSANLSFNDDVGKFSISLNISTRISLGRHEKLPRLLMSPSSFHADLIVYGSPQLNYSFPRVFIDLMTVHGKQNVSLFRTSRIDDEYSPGVFSDDTLAVGGGKDKAYIRWKPVGYSRPDRIIAHTVDALKFLGNNTQQRLTPEISPPLFGFYHPKHAQEYNCQNLTIFMGAAKDIMYSETNFTSFSFNVGLGEPADEGLSFLVQMVILIGFGLPAIALMASTVFVGYRRWKRSRVVLIDSP